MEDYVAELSMELEEDRPLRPEWLTTKLAYSDCRLPAERALAGRRRGAGGQVKGRSTHAKSMPSPLALHATDQNSDLYPVAHPGLHERGQIYPEYIMHALAAADDAQAAGESELTISLIKLVCELLYEMGRRP